MTDSMVVVRDEHWTKERIEVVKRQFCPSGITDAELSVFVEVCRRSGLDPFQKEIFCVPRRVNAGGRDSPRWIQKHEAQPAEAGLLARADRFQDFQGIKAAAIYEGDEIAVNEDGVRHTFNPAKRQGRLVGAWAQAFREGRVLPVELVRFEDYKQETAQWKSKPETMIVKCARAAALRRAYPNAFGGLYLKEEMPPEDFDNGQAGGAILSARGRDSVRSSIRQPSKAAPTLPADTEPPPNLEEPPPVEPTVELEPGADVEERTSYTIPPAKQDIKQFGREVWNKAKKKGLSPDEFKTWSAVVLTKSVPSIDWTWSDLKRLDAQLDSMMLDGVG